MRRNSFHNGNFKLMAQQEIIQPKHKNPYFVPAKELFIGCSILFMAVCGCAYTFAEAVWFCFHRQIIPVFDIAKEIFT